MSNSSSYFSLSNVKVVLGDLKGFLQGVLIVGVKFVPKNLRPFKEI